MYIQCTVASSVCCFKELFDRSHFNNLGSIIIVYLWELSVNLLCYKEFHCIQDEIFRRKRLSTGANFVHVYLEIWDKGILKFSKLSM